MLFPEPAFLFFFLPVLLVLYQASPRPLRNALLTVASLGFYAVGEKLYAGIMLASIVLNWLVGLRLGESASPGGRRAWLTFGVVANLALLGFFKYANFLVDNLNELLALGGLPAIDIGRVHLPIGISFYTFQAMSYLIDVSRGTKPQRSLMNVALFISLFPQLIAGPIVRYGMISGQLAGRLRTARLFNDGVRRFIVGLAKKTIIANAMALPADRIFGLPPDELTTPLAWLGMIAYTLQIYFDFSGYSDMAIGLGRMFGFHFPLNFRYPYAARDITDFWRRWHISLSTWFRDYLYIPLGGNRGGEWRTYRNLLIVFLCCGLWHGASWLFVAWGLYHGAFLIVERMGLGAGLRALPRPVGQAYTVLAVMFGWVLFRVATGPNGSDDPLAFASSYYGQLLPIGRLLDAPSAGLEGSVRTVSEFFSAYEWIVLAVGVITSQPVFGALARGYRRLRRHLPTGRERRLDRAAGMLGDAYLAAVFAYCLALIAANTYSPFIYFQF